MEIGDCVVKRDDCLARVTETGLCGHHTIVWSVKAHGDWRVSGNEPKFHGNHLNWEVEKTDRTFRVYVVEPDAYDPASHAGIFNAALNALIALKSDRLDPYEQQPIRFEHPVPFDLVTFPEAFLSSDDLLVVLNSLGNWPRFGCIHVGLRPTIDANQHLFTVGELHKLLAAIGSSRGWPKTIFRNSPNG